MFNIFDLNFNKVELPFDTVGFGIKGLDLEISSIEHETFYKTLPGYPGQIDGGTRASTRDASIKMLLQTRDSKDFHLKTDEIYAFFRKLDVFYVSKYLNPHKLLKVRVSQKYSLERPENMQNWSVFTIELDVVGSPYKVSQYTTMDIHNNGVRLDNHKWDYGMGLLKDDRSHQYRFNNQIAFEIYNAGDVTLKTIQEYQDCIITIKVLNSMDYFEISDHVGNTFKYNPTYDSYYRLKAGDVITINGPHVKRNGINILNRTNVEWLEIVPGWNIFKCSNGLDIIFDFRFKYD